MASESATGLEVWLLNQRAGTLWLKDGELQFQYSALWLSLAGVQVKLPVVIDCGWGRKPLASRA